MKKLGYVRKKENKERQREKYCVSCKEDIYLNQDCDESAKRRTLN